MAISFNEMMISFNEMMISFNEMNFLQGLGKVFSPSSPLFSPVLTIVLAPKARKKHLQGCPKLGEKRERWYLAGEFIYPQPQLFMHKHPVHSLLISLTLLLLLSVACCTAAYGQTALTDEGGTMKHFLSTRPLSWVSGPEIGYDYAVTPKMTLGFELNAPLWFEGDRSLFLSPAYRYYFREAGGGWYLKARLLGGLFFDDSDFDWAAGAGIGAGWMKPLGKAKRWYFFAELNLNAVYLHEKDPSDPIVATPVLPLYILFAPYSFAEPLIGFSYRF